MSKVTQDVKLATGAETAKKAVTASPAKGVLKTQHPGPTQQSKHHSGEVITCEPTAPRVHLLPNQDAHGNWPEVNPKLQPVNTPENIAAYHDGKFWHSEEQDASHRRFLGEEATLISLKQEETELSLCLGNVDGAGFVQPKNALIDGGAEVTIMISEQVARTLKLTWKAGAANLVGVGGTNDALGVSNQSIPVYLGAYAGNHQEATPFRGCFSIMVRPLIMTSEVERIVAHEVVIGQAFLRMCLGSVDCYSNHLEFSPAWLSHKCPEFRVRVPCVMTKKVNVATSRVGVLLAGFKDGGSLQELLSHMPDAPVLQTVTDVKASVAVKPADQNAPAAEKPADQKGSTC